MCKSCEALIEQNMILQRRLKVVKDVAENIDKNAKNRMAGGNLPRGNWAFLRGVSKSANAVLKALR